jgi:hypothetical protein
VCGSSIIGPQQPKPVWRSEDRPKP